MSHYTLPTAITPQSLISLAQSSNKADIPLMMGSVDVVVKNQDTHAEIMLSHCTSALNIVLTQVPDHVKAVAVSFSSVYGSLSLGGELTDPNKIVTITCTKDAQSELWSSPTVYCLPTSSNQLILSIALTDDEGVKTYGYTYAGTLIKGVPFFLNGSYRDAFNISGSLDAEGWGSPIEINFDFGAAVVDDPAEEIPEFSVSTLPDPGTSFMGALIVGVNYRSTEEADLLLLSPYEWTEVLNSEAKTLVSGYSLSSGASRLTNWRLPTRTEASFLKGEVNGDEELLALLNVTLQSLDGVLLKMGDTGSGSNAVRYLCYDENSEAIYSFNFTSSGTISQAGSSRTYSARAVKVVSVTTIR